MKMECETDVSTQELRDELQKRDYGKIKEIMYDVEKGVYVVEYTTWTFHGKELEEDMKENGTYQQPKVLVRQHVHIIIQRIY